MKLTLALSKGRIFEETTAILSKIGIRPLEDPEKSRKLIIETSNPDVRYWQVRHAQHFDGFLALPAYGARYVPLLPYVYAALDQVDATLDGRRELPANALINANPRGAGSVEASQFAIPR